MYGGGSKGVFGIKQPPPRREPKRKPQDPSDSVSGASFANPSSILKHRKAQARKESNLPSARKPVILDEPFDLKARLEEGASYDREPYSLQPTPGTYHPSSSIFQRLETERGLDLCGKTSITVGQHELAIIGHGCGYIRGTPLLEFRLFTLNYAGLCAIDCRRCTSSINQDAETCPRYQRALEKWMKEDAREQEKYERADIILPISEND